MIEEDICKMIYQVIFSLLLREEKMKSGSYSKVNWKEDGRFIVMIYVLNQTSAVGSYVSLNVTFQL